MSKLLGVGSRIRFWNAITNVVEEVTVIGFGHPPNIRVARLSTIREEDRNIEVKESDIWSTYNPETCEWETYPGFNKENPIPC